MNSYYAPIGRARWAWLWPMGRWAYIIRAYEDGTITIEPSPRS